MLAQPRSLVAMRTILAQRKLKVAAGRPGRRCDRGLATVVSARWAHDFRRPPSASNGWNGPLSKLPKWLAVS